MDELEEILWRELRTRPEARPGDLIKLIYQNEFAGGHLITDRAAAARRLRLELDSVEPDGTLPLYESIGNGLARLNLAALKARRSAASPETVSGLFAVTARTHRGSVEGFERKLEILRALCASGAAGFGDISPELERYRAEGYPARSHSPEYRAAYSPAYRVLDERLCENLGLFESIDACLADRGRCIIAIDGGSGTGKSSLAALAQEVYGEDACNLFHTDDFFLQKHQRTPERFSQPGGNVDYERLEAEVLRGIASGKPFGYRRFDCSTMSLGDLIEAQPRRISIVEGVYSLHPALQKYYDARYILSAPYGKRLGRIRERDGEYLLGRFVREWIPMEDRYFAAIGAEQEE